MRISFEYWQSLPERNIFWTRRHFGGLTFDMRGGRQPAKPDVARPLDGRVRLRDVLLPTSNQQHANNLLLWAGQIGRVTVCLEPRIEPGIRNIFETGRADHTE